MKLQQKDVIRSFRKAHGNKYDYSLVKYINNLTKVKIICPIHGEFLQMPKLHKNGNGCQKCSKNYTWGVEYIINQFNEIHNNKYNYSKVNYINDRTKIKIICPIHGEFSQTPNNHKAGKGCNKCGNIESSKKQSMSLSEFIKKSNKIHNNFFYYDKSIYVNNSTKLIITCPLHGDFEMTPNNHLNNKGCSKCNSSKGEKEIKKILTKCGIKFTEQKKFNDLLSDKNKYLKYDFYLPEYNLCIEYNGKQHYESIDFFGGIKSYKRRVKLDNMKKKYCIKNNIKLLIIPYWDKSNIAIILNNI